MAFHVDIQNQGNYLLNDSRLQAAATTVLAQHNALPDTGLSVVIADDKFVAGLNRQFRGVDAPTDVLSFPADAPPVKEDDEPPYLGDLIIAYPYAAAQAEREGHPLDDSLALLVVHGTLHLLGYDHDTPENGARMWAAQEAALTALNIPLAYVPALEEGQADDEAH
ncbi:MAG: rRNA maturation RNase YbeY [Chloroflexi bacterium]|nr:rRNA maturation RNase YbeY [Chloroflexota bacterium]